jgi:predicted ribosome quality control (RQC) complex YloA/Tae2 family protein
VRYWQLLATVDFLQNFQKIKSARRIDFETIELLLDGEFYLYISLNKENPTLFSSPKQLSKTISDAPFDTVLERRFSRGELEVSIVPNDKILLVKSTLKGAYKQSSSILRVEFIKRNPNAIIIDEQGIVLEAIKHSSKKLSGREISSGKKLDPLPSPEISFDATIKEVFEPQKWLLDIYIDAKKRQLEQKKRVALKRVEKKVSKLKTILNSLEKESTLQSEAMSLNKMAQAILQNLDKIELHAKNIKLPTYEGEMVDVEIPPISKTPTHAANLLFTKSKKLQKKAKNIHLQREDVLSKIEFNSKIMQNIEKSENIDEVEIYLPKKGRQAKKEGNLFEQFYKEGYTIVVGRNQSENKKLLENAKSEDIWFHIRNIPSSHVIIKADKRAIPQSVIETAAKICVDFGVDKVGDYEVDYTKRKFVKLKEGANVVYDKYKTLQIQKE